MSEYVFSTIGKIKAIFATILFFGPISVILVLIGTLGYLKYIIWLPILWIAYHIFSTMMYFCTTRFFLDGEGLSIVAPLNVIKKIPWEDIEKIVQNKQKSEVVSLKIFIRSWKRPLILDNTIRDYGELFNKILSNVKVSK